MNVSGTQAVCAKAPRQKKSDVIEKEEEWSVVTWRDTFPSILCQVLCLWFSLLLLILIPRGPF